MSKPETMGMPTTRHGVVPANRANLYYELRGAGPALLLIPGASGDAGMYAMAAEHLSRDFTVLTYDRRGNSRSLPPAGWEATTVDEQADDAAALITALDLAPAHVFGNSSGATIAINLALRHPGVLRTVVAHEPPKIGTLPNRDEFLAQLRDRMDAAVKAGGYGHAMDDFHGWLTGPDDADIDAADLRQRVQANGENWIRRELGVVDRYDPPAELVARRTTPLVIGIGTTGGTELHTALLATYTEALRQLAEHLGARFLSFTGAHVPYQTVPDTFAAELGGVLLAAGEDGGR
ncbi:alpha/beta fold hydrolase [Specibacter cremeus]|uniref:alpha/beta fold hydrolase n=1 Tax=Specibacter cremeus TaxID=1629051 RepID=UPI000F78FFCE|nr:alpha/beta hydrolase [Specibacter cremeus]